MTLHPSLARLHPTTYLLPALAALAGDRPAIWSPPPGATLTQTHVVELATELESLELNLAGREIEPREAFEDFRREAWEPGATLAFRATDRELRLAPAPPLAGTVPLGFERSYASTRATGELARTLAALLPAEPIRFERAAATKSFRRERADGTTEPDFALLAEDLSWRLLEPGSERAPESLWSLELDPASAAALLTGLVDAEGLTDGAAPAQPWALLLARLHTALSSEGRVTVEWVADEHAEPSDAVELDGDRAATLVLSGALHSTLEVAELLPEVATFEDDRGRPLATETEAELRLALDLTGRGLWSPAAGILREGSVTWRGTAELTARVRPLGPDGPLPVPLTLEARWSVELTHRLAVTVD